MSLSVPRVLLTATLIATVVAAEASLVIRFLEEPGSLLVLLALHAGVAILAMLLLLRRDARRQPLLLLFVVAVAFLGPLGIIGTGLAALLRIAFAWRARPFLEWYEALFPAFGQDRTEALHERVVLRGHGPSVRSTVAPFGDIMARGTLAEKQSALSLIGAGFRPEFAPALRSALNDPEASIRVQAASAVAQIERHFVERGETLAARRAERPDDASLIELAQHHEALAASGLLDAGRARDAATTALALHLRLAEQGPGLPLRMTSAGAAGRLLLNLGRAEEAVRLLTRANSESPPTAEILGPYLDSLFRLRRFVDLRDICRRLSHDTAQSRGDALDDVIRLWGDDGDDTLLMGRSV